MTNGICARCARNRPCFDRAYSPFLYTGPVTSLVHELKYRGKEHLGALLGGFMADFMQNYAVSPDSIDCVVAMPLHPAKLREREFNQAGLLAAPVARRLGKPLDTLLERKRATRTQTELSQERRARNVAGAFSAKPEAAGKRVLLVDDVLTTGATASAASRALKEAGAEHVIVLTLAT